MKRARMLLPLFLLAFAAMAPADTLVERFEGTWPLQGEEFSLDNVNGSVSVTAWDRDEVRIEAEKRIRARRRDAAADAMKELRIEVTRTSKGLEVRTRYPRERRGAFDLFDLFSGSDFSAKVDYRIKLPRGARLVIDTVNAAIEVDGVEGGFALVTVNGRIDVVRGAGSFEASTVNGAIDAQLMGSDPSKVRISTVNGKVALALPADIRADVEVSTVNGRISSELPLTASEMGRRKLRGTINGGGGVPIHISTVNGSIRLGPS
ncbi:MAG TPA: hypothetical protein VMS56_10390 [Thermoanaerobaculia bacterium]|nr:hypothetical protein [Thermoanaerobaculia bacterium]